MSDNTERIIQLLSKRLLGPLSDAEEKELREWINCDPRRQSLSERLSDSGRLAEFYRKRSLVNPERARKEMHRRLDAYRSGSRKAGSIFWIAGAVAAVLAIVWLMNPSEQITAPVEVAPVAKAKLSIDSLHPGESVAYLNEGGKKVSVSIDEGSQGIPVEDLRKKCRSKGPMVLEVPRGGEFIVMLEDSTKVWLNSASKLSYPESFGADSRRVSVAGEAYFSVAKDESRPFYVECEGQEIQVYGTEFNVRAYPEDESVFTTLSSGSIALRRLDHAGGELMLSPGKQAVFNKTTQQAQVKQVNIETVTGWRHGRFVFENQTLLQIMNDLGRWYDFEFEFADPDLENLIFMGSIPRYGNFSTAMLILEKSGDVSFRSDGDKIIVSRRH